MTDPSPSQIAQLLLARGHLSLPQLLEAVGDSAQASRDLTSFLVEERVVAPAAVEQAREFLREAPADQVAQDLRSGETLVVSQIHQTHGRRAVSASGATLAPPPVKLPEPDLTLTHESRYAVRDELGRGGMGLVVRARDAVMRRDIALKTLVERLQGDSTARRRLFLEAQVTGHLEHPNIVPVYDIGHLQGEPFYTMRVAREESLADLLERQRRGDAVDFSLTQMVSTLRQVALAVQYAHDEGVIHRDLKPENILVGSYGEVFVIDWGVARVVNPDIGEFSMVAGEASERGSLVGTPQYMSPEQALGLHDELDGRSDVYALGATLYESLTLKPVHEAPSVLSLLFKVAQEAVVPPSKRSPERSIPPELEEICMRALAKDPADRHPTCDALADDLELFLEGVKERQRHQQLATEAIRAGEQARAQHQEMRSDYIELLRMLHRAEERTPSWASQDAKKVVWNLEARVEEHRVAKERRFGEATQYFSQALGYIPDDPTARRALAGLYWSRFEEAESQGDRAQATYFEGLVRQHNDGDYDALLEGQAFLEVRTSTPGFSVRVYRFEEEQRRLRPRLVASPGRTPLNRLTLAHGSYVLVLQRAGFAPMRVPVRLGRFEERRLQIQVYEADRIPEDFVVIAAGEFLSGRVQPLDPESSLAHVSDFAIQRHPVTYRQYLEFLNSLQQRDPQAALEHALRIGEQRGPVKSLEQVYLARDERGVFGLPEADAEGDSPTLDWPVAMVNYHDVQAYIAWASARLGRPLRLPSAREWEKAARGVDGRLYPWGNHFDASFCCMKDSTSGKPLPTPVGAFRPDTSVYGVGDMAGNLFEWTSTIDQDHHDRRIVQGASFNSIAMMCRLDWHMDVQTERNLPYLGFRVAMELG